MPAGTEPSGGRILPDSGRNSEGRVS